MTNDHFIIDSSASNKKVILQLKLVKIGTEINL